MTGRQRFFWLLFHLFVGLSYGAKAVYRWAWSNYWMGSRGVGSKYYRRATTIHPFSLKECWRERFKD